MQEYLEVAEDISEKRKQGWRIAELGKTLEGAFKLGDRIVQVDFEDTVSGRQWTIYHTPVSSKLQKQGKQLGNYLHAMKTYRKPDDPWWYSFKSLLGETCEGLAIATKGTLLGPPLFRPDGKTLDTHHELGIDPLADEAMTLIGRVGGDIRLGVKYLNNLPSEGA